MAEVSVKQAAGIFKALANPGRLQLLMTMAGERVCDVATLGRLCNRPQPYVSQQLRILRDHQLIIGQQCAQRVCYRLSSPAVENMLKAARLAWLPKEEVRPC